MVDCFTKISGREVEGCEVGGGTSYWLDLTKIDQDLSPDKLRDPTIGGDEALSRNREGGGADHTEQQKECQ